MDVGLQNGKRLGSKGWSQGATTFVRNPRIQHPSGHGSKTPKSEYSAHVPLVDAVELQILQVYRIQCCEKRRREPADGAHRLIRSLRIETGFSACI